MPEEIKNELAALIAQKYAGGVSVGFDDSLFYSGMIDSLGIAEIATLLSKRFSRDLDATAIVENDYDTINLLIAWAKG